MKKYIAYLRVSAKTQGIDGLGIEAQKQTVERFLTGRGVTIEPEYYLEVESGKKSDRKELRKAINRCKEIGSTLLIAKLDRLSRNVVFIFTLRDELQNAGVDFMALDIPEANTLTIGLMATFAQHERERISARTKDALNVIKETIKKQGYAISKKNGKRFESLGNPTLSISLEKANIASCKSKKEKRQSDDNFIKTYNYAALLAEKKMSVSEIATELNRAGYRAPRGGCFIQQHINRLLKDGRKLLTN